MESSFLKDLWVLRFEKMKKGEEDAAWMYQELLDQCLTLLDKDHPVIPLLQMLVREERMHEKLAEQLIQISHNTHPEFGFF